MYDKIKSKKDYDLLLKSGMMWEFHPELTGSWNIDKKMMFPNSYPKPGEKIVVWFSCGAASAVAAKMILQEYGNTNEVVVVNNPIKEEDVDNYRFLKDVEKWLGVEIKTAVNSKYKKCSAVEVWDDRQYMAGIAGAPCTLELKKKARYEWEIKNRPDWTVLGFTKEEKGRFDKFQLNERPASIWVLEDTTKAECFEIIMKAGITLPLIYRMGYPNANCIGCVKANSPTYWNHVRKMHPEVFEARAKQSREIGADGKTIKLVKVKGKRIHLDDLDPKTKGRSMKNLDFECGIFCAK